LVIRNTGKAAGTRKLRIEEATKAIVIDVKEP